jgi:hypothetical protein
MSEDDGRHDFDFLFGRWRIENHKRVDVYDLHRDEWVDFEARAEAWPVLGGLANVDTFSVAALPPHGRAYDGMSLRLFDPARRLWRIWWASTYAPGALDVPVEGSFDAHGRGVFVADDEYQGRPFKVRFEWTVLSANEAAWEQFFSRDAGTTWETNWRMSLTRSS